MQLSRYSGDLSTVDFVDLLIVDISGAPRSLPTGRPTPRPAAGGKDGRSRPSTSCRSG